MKTKQIFKPGQPTPEQPSVRSHILLVLFALFGMGYNFISHLFFSKTTYNAVFQKSVTLMQSAGEKFTGMVSGLTSDRL